MSRGDRRARRTGTRRGDRHHRVLHAPGRRVVSIDHLGSFSCRAIHGSGSLSQHALGRAIDIAGFRLSDGTTVSVEHDWSEPGPKRLFLHHLARRACSYFSVVLTPDRNADHYNHIRLDIGPERMCSV